jgi:chromosome segregation ATPase
VERIRLAAEAGLRDIRSDISERRRQVEPKKHLLLELEHQIREEYAQPELDEPADGKEEPEEEEEVTVVDLGVRDRGQELKTLVRAVQSKHDELENHLASLARDADIAGRLFDRLQSKLQKDSAGDGQKAKPAEPEEP